jgi:hypothetical protein
MITSILRRAPKAAGNTLISYPRLTRGLLRASALTLGLLPSAAWACACGCGVFAVGTSSSFPTDAGAMAFVEYDFMNQNKNWHGNSSAPADDNDDKRIRTSFYTAGFQYVLADGWGFTAELPYWNRFFKTTDDDTGDIVGFKHTAIGDVRIQASYSGFSDDRTTGITFGVKLPTGDFTYPNFDRDTSIGTGSTDLLLGAYHVGNLTPDYSWNWFANAQIDQPIASQDGYRPGGELDAVVGVSYNNWSVGDIKVAPVLEVIGSYRLHDSGINSDRPDSGYERMLIAPGLEVDVSQFKVYANVALPIYQHVTGEQLTAPVLVKLNVSYSF